jgi:hypothetical protein
MYAFHTLFSVALSLFWNRLLFLRLVKVGEISPYLTSRLMLRLNMYWGRFCRCGFIRTTSGSTVCLEARTWYLPKQKAAVLWITAGRSHWLSIFGPFPPHPSVPLSFFTPPLPGQYFPSQKKKINQYWVSDRNVEMGALPFYHMHWFVNPRPADPFCAVLFVIRRVSVKWGQLSRDVSHCFELIANTSEVLLTSMWTSHVSSKVVKRYTSGCPFAHHEGVWGHGVKTSLILIFEATWRW